MHISKEENIADHTEQTSQVNGFSAFLCMGRLKKKSRAIKILPEIYIWLSMGLGFPCGSAGKESACNVEELGSIPGLGRSPEEWKVYSSILAWRSSWTNPVLLFFVCKLESPREVWKILLTGFHPYKLWFYWPGLWPRLWDLKTLQRWFEHIAWLRSTALTRLSNSQGY